MASTSTILLHPQQIEHFVDLFYKKHKNENLDIIPDNYVIFSKDLKIGEFNLDERYVIFSLRDTIEQSIRDVIVYGVSNFYFNSMIGQFFLSNVDYRSNQPIHKISFFHVFDLNKLQVSSESTEENGDKCICFQLEQLNISATPLQFMPPRAEEFQGTTNGRQQTPYGMVVNKEAGSSKFVSLPVPAAVRAYGNTSQFPHATSRKRDRTNNHYNTRGIPVADFTETGQYFYPNGQFSLFAPPEKALSFYEYLNDKRKQSGSKVNNKRKQSGSEVSSIKQLQKRVKQLRGGGKNKKTKKRKHKKTKTRKHKKKKSKMTHKKRRR